MMTIRAMIQVIRLLCCLTKVAIEDLSISPKAARAGLLMVPEKNRTIGLLSRDLHSKDLHMSLMRDLLTRKKILLTCGHRNTNKSDLAVTDPLNMNRLAHLMRNRLTKKRSLPT